MKKFFLILFTIFCGHSTAFSDDLPPDAKDVFDFAKNNFQYMMKEDHHNEINIYKKFNDDWFIEKIESSGKIPDNYDSVVESKETENA